MTLTAQRHHAKDRVEAFAARYHPQAFCTAGRQIVADGLQERLDDPNWINQQGVGICGPTSIVYSLALHRPLAYVDLVINLFEHGRARLGNWTLEPCRELKHHAMPDLRSGIEQADWIPTASIRDCENWFFDYYSASQENGGGMKHGDMADIFKKAGFKHVRDSVQDGHPRDLHNLHRASQYYQNDYSVCLCVDANLLKHLPPQGRHNHWIVLTSEVVVDANGLVAAEVFSWGKTRHLYSNPHKHHKYTSAQFLEYYYGYVVCKL